MMHSITGTITVKVASADMILHFTNGTLIRDTDTVDVTTLGQSGDVIYGEEIAGVTRWRGNLEGFVDDAADIPQNVAGRVLKKIHMTYTDGTNTYNKSGDCIISNFQQSLDRNDAVKWTAEFRGTGALADAAP